MEASNKNSIPQVDSQDGENPTRKGAAQLMLFNRANKLGDLTEYNISLINYRYAIRKAKRDFLR